MFTALKPRDGENAVFLGWRPQVLRLLPSRQLLRNAEASRRARRPAAACSRAAAAGRQTHLRGQEEAQQVGQQHGEGQRGAPRGRGGGEHRRQRQRGRRHARSVSRPNPTPHTQKAFSIP